MSHQGQVSSLMECEEFYETQKSTLEQCVAVGKTLLGTLMEMEVEVAEMTVTLHTYLDPNLAKRLEETKEMYEEMKKKLDMTNEQDKQDMMNERDVEEQQERTSEQLEMQTEPSS